MKLNDFAKRLLDDAKNKRTKCLVSAESDDDTRGAWNIIHEYLEAKIVSSIYPDLILLRNGSKIYFLQNSDLEKQKGEGFDRWIDMP